MSTAEERAPLLSSPRESPKRKFQTISDSFKIWNTLPQHEFDHNNKLVYYDHEKLISWRAACSLGGSALFQKPVVVMVISCWAIAFVSACLVIFLLPDARKLNTKRFGMFLTFLKFFISFMLGIYVRMAFGRWQTSLSVFEKYLIAIKQMLFVFHSIKVNQDELQEVQRQAIAASYVINTEIHSLQQMERDTVGRMEHTLDWLRDEDMLLSEEHAKLKVVMGWKASTQSFGTLAVACTVWAWIGELVSQASLESGAAIAPPMHVRMLALCQDCMTRVEELKMNIVTQVPYMYAQLLAILVYTNNFLLAVCCGLAIGSSVAEVHDRHKQLQRTGAEERRGHMDRVGEFYEAIQTVAVQVVIVIFEPMLYMAFLNIGHMLCYPFGNRAYHMPTESFIARLHIDLLVIVDGREWSRERRERLANQPKLDERTGRIATQDKKKDDVDIEAGDEGGDGDDGE